MPCEFYILLAHQTQNFHLWNR